MNCNPLNHQKPTKNFQENILEDIAVHVWGIALKNTYICMVVNISYS